MGADQILLSNPAVSHSGEVDSLLIEKYFGQIHAQYIKGENHQVHFNVLPVNGTNTVSNKYIGETQLQILVPGQIPKATQTAYDKNALTVDTAVIARNAISHLQDVQNDINDNKTQLAKNQASKLKRLEDKMIVQQLIFGALSNGFTGAAAETPGLTNGARATARLPGHGFSVQVDLRPAEALLPNQILAAIEFVMETQMTQEVDRNDQVVFVPWDIFYILQDAERVVNKDYTTNSGTIKEDGFVLKRNNIPIIPTNRFPTSVDDVDLKLLSSGANDNRYTPTAAQLLAIALVFTADALIVGKSIDVQADIYFDKTFKGYHVDSWMAEGAIPDRWESVGVVTRAAGSENTVVSGRADRKAKVTTVV